MLKALEARASICPTACPAWKRGTSCPWRQSTRGHRGCGGFGCEHIGLLLGLDGVLLISDSFVSKPVAHLNNVIIKIEITTLFNLCISIVGKIFLEVYVLYISATRVDNILFFVLFQATTSGLVHISPVHSIVDATSFSTAKSEDAM